MGNLFSSSSDSAEQQAAHTSGRINKRQKTGVHLSSMQETMICEQCNDEIDGSYTKAMNKYFHLDCFQCCKCRKPVRTSKFYRIDDQVYCQQDYDRFVNPDIDICAVCLERILGNGKAFESRDHCYHEKCFRCRSCGTQLKPAQEFFTRSSSNSSGTQGLEVYCKPCKPNAPASKITMTTETFSGSSSSSSSDTKSSSSDSGSSSGPQAATRKSSKSNESTSKDTSSSSSSSSSSSTTKKKKKKATTSGSSATAPKDCAACTKLIDGTVMTALNRSYHPACFVCAKCKQPFLHNKFFVDHSTNDVYCRADFPYKLFPESQAKAFDSEQHGKEERVAAKRKRQGSR